MEHNMMDIAGLIGLLKSMAAVSRLPSGESLSLTVSDADVYTALVRVIENDAHCRMIVTETPQGHRLTVTKI